MRNKILVLGYFGYGTTQFDGQTIKTRNVYELLKLKSNDSEDILYFDTYQFKESVFFLLKMISSILRCNKLVYIPAHNNLKYLFPLIYTICKLKRIEILYIVVGGWLAEYLGNKKLHVFLLSGIRGIFSQSDQLSLKLKDQYHFKNVITFPNFRIHSFFYYLKSDHSHFKIVYMARINRMKGIDSVFRLAKYISETPFLTKPIVIHFYGPIDKSDEDYFFKQVDKSDIITYHGVLPPEIIHETLAEYDLLVLPTRFYTEGFPGTILDAYISSVPVVVTKWKYATEFVDHGKTGLIVPFENGEKDFIDSVMRLYFNQDLLSTMRKNVYERSKQYSSDYAWSILEKYIS